MLREQIRKMDCERCRLRTEHYLLSDDGTLRFCRCLRCGQLKEDLQGVAEDHEPYPVDGRKPVYVV